MKRLITGVLGAGLLVASVAVVGAFQKQDFTLINKTGLTIEKVYLSKPADNSWGEDVMGRDVLADGETVDIKFAHAESACKWDMKLVDSRKEAYVWEALDLCKCEKITVSYNADTKKTLAKCDVPAPASR